MFEETIAQKLCCATVFIKYFSMFPVHPDASRCVPDLGKVHELFFTDQENDASRSRRVTVVATPQGAGGGF
jgi:hypothetical protein